jgi:hypothetical protein
MTIIHLSFSPSPPPAPAPNCIPNPAYQGQNIATFPHPARGGTSAQKNKRPELHASPPPPFHPLLPLHTPDHFWFREKKG